MIIGDIRYDAAGAPLEPARHQLRAAIATLYDGPLGLERGKWHSYRVSGRDRAQLGRRATQVLRRLQEAPGFGLLASHEYLASGVDDRDQLVLELVYCIRG